MTSSNGNIFRVTGHLCREFTGDRWIPSTKANDAELWCFLWSAPWINGWVNTRGAGDLRRRRGHYDVTVMFFSIAKLKVTLQKLRISYSDKAQRRLMNYTCLWKDSLCNLITSLWKRLMLFMQTNLVKRWLITQITTRFQACIIKLVGKSKPKKITATYYS